MKRAWALLGAVGLTLVAGCSAAPPRPLAFVTPTFVGGVYGIPANLREPRRWQGGSVTAIDVASPTLEIAWRRDPKPLDQNPDRALQVAYDRRRERVWVGDLDGPGLVVLDAPTGETLHSLELPHQVVGIALSPDGKRLVTAARDALEAYVVDAGSGALIATIPTGSIAPTDSSLPSFFTAHPAFLDNRHALVQDNVHGVLVRIDLDEKKVDARFELGSPVHAIDRSPRGDRLVALVEGVAGKTPPRVLVLDPTTGEPGASVVIPLDEGELPRLHHGAFSHDGQRYYVANMGPLKPPVSGKPGHTITEIDLSDPAMPLFVHGASAGDGAGHPILSPDGKLLYVVNHHERYVSVFDAATLEARPPLELAHGKGFGHGVAFFEGSLLVLCSTDGDLVRVAPDGTITRRALGAVLGELEPGW